MKTLALVGWAILVTSQLIVVLYSSGGVKLGVSTLPPLAKKTPRMGHPSGYFKVIDG
jgi:hypothetical protein